MRVPLPLLLALLPAVLAWLSSSGGYGAALLAILRPLMRGLLPALTVSCFSLFSFSLPRLAPTPLLTHLRLHSLHLPACSLRIVPW